MTIRCAFSSAERKTSRHIITEYPKRYFLSLTIQRKDVSVLYAVRNQKYNYYHYSQLGDFYCPSCGFKRPEIDFEVKNVSLDTPMKFTINNQPMVINYKGFYNIYNLIAVYGALNVLG